MQNQASSGTGGSLPSFDDLLKETKSIYDTLKKHDDYKVKPAAARPSLSDIDSVVAGTFPEASLSPKPKSPNARNGSQEALENYDPKANTELEKTQLSNAVLSLRTLDNKLMAQLSQLQHKLSDLKMTQKQLENQDKVEEEKRAGIQRINEIKEKMNANVIELEDVERYHKTLNHMLKRCQSEKIAHLSTMKAFEEAIKVHKMDFNMKEKLLRDVTQSKETERLALQQMKEDVNRQLQILDQKLESRRIEVNALKGKSQKINAMKAVRTATSGDLSQPELTVRNQTLREDVESTLLLAQKTRDEADAAEKLFNSIRFAAGVKEKGPLHTAADGSQYHAPSASQILEKYPSLKRELTEIDLQYIDFQKKYSNLQRQQNQLLQVRASLISNENPSASDRTVDALESAAALLEECKRRYEAAVLENTEYEALRSRSEQAISTLEPRLRSIPLPPHAELLGQEPPANGASSDSFLSQLAGLGLSNMRGNVVTGALTSQALHEFAAFSAVAEDLRSLPRPSEWSSHFANTLLDCLVRARKLQFFVDPKETLQRSTIASIANGDLGVKTGEESVDAAAPETSESSDPEEKQNVTSESENDLQSAGGLDSLSAEKEQEKEQKKRDEITELQLEQQHASNLSKEADRRVEATIESLIEHNEYSIRVKPLSQSLAGSRTVVSQSVQQAAISKAVDAATAAFDAALKSNRLGSTGSSGQNGMSGYGFIPGATSGSTMSSAALSQTHKEIDAEYARLNPLSKAASLQRRRNSRIEINEALMTANLAALGTEDMDAIGAATAKGRSARLSQQSAAASETTKTKLARKALTAIGSSLASPI